MTARTRPGRVSPLLVAGVVAAALGAAAAGYFIFGPKKGNDGYGRGSGSTKDAQNNQAPAGAVESLGRIQPSGGLISVYGPTADKIVRFRVNTGDPVAEDAILADLAGEEERKLTIATLDAQIKEAEALRKATLALRDSKLADIEDEARRSLVGIDEDMKVIDAKVSAVEAGADAAKKTLRRLEEAKGAGVNIADEEFEQIRLKLRQAEAERAGAVATKEKIVAQRDESGKSIETKKATLRAETDRALAAVPSDSLLASKRLAERKQKDGEMRAPTAGKVVRLVAKPGDTLTTQPAIQLANVSRMSVLAEVYETDVGRIREWLRKGAVVAEIDGKALGTDAKLRGTVANAAKISTVIARNALTPLGPREDADRRVVEVEVDLDASSAKMAEAFIGLQVRVRFEPPK